LLQTEVRQCSEFSAANDCFVLRQHKTNVSKLLLHENERKANKARKWSLRIVTL
jgi:hypothetical protein